MLPFVLRPDDRYPRLWEHEATEYEVLRCPRVPGHRRAGRRLGPLAVRVDPRAKRRADVMFIFGAGCVVTPVVARALAAQFTGIGFRPATLWRGRSPERVAELCVRGWAGMAAPASGIRRRYRCRSCGVTDYWGPRHPEKIVAPRRWDGSDVFMVWPLPAYILLTEEAAVALDASGLTGFRVEPLEAQPFYSPFTTRPTLTPGRLIDAMPAPLARRRARTIHP